MILPAVSDQAGPDCIALDVASICRRRCDVVIIVVLPVFLLFLFVVQKIFGILFCAKLNKKVTYLEPIKGPHHFHRGRHHHGEDNGGTDTQT